MSKLIFLDVDGTLVDYHNRIPESAIKAIRQAREKGHLVYVCTGRSKAEMQPELWEIGFGWDDWWQWLLCGASWPSPHASADFQGRCSEDCGLADRAPSGLFIWRAIMVSLPVLIFSGAGA